ncbi:MAG: tetratricopeptide repeat protein, partial [Candidatus Eiseniibacteriota bacterium]
MNTSPSPHSLRPLRAAAPRFKRLAPLLAAIIFAFSDPRSALAWETPAESLLAVSPDPRSLRTALAALAKSAAARDPRLSSEALYWRGVSAAREGKADSAIASLERAGRIFPFDDQQLALADAWMARGHPADLAAAAQLMHDAAPFADVNQDRVPFRARLGWALFLAGQADSAVNVFAPINHY